MVSLLPVVGLRVVPPAVYNVIGGAEFVSQSLSRTRLTSVTDVWLL